MITRKVSLIRIMIPVSESRYYNTTGIINDNVSILIIVLPVSESHY